MLALFINQSVSSHSTHLQFTKIVTKKQKQLCQLNMKGMGIIVEKYEADSKIEPQCFKREDQALAPPPQPHAAIAECLSERTPNTPLW